MKKSIAELFYGKPWALKEEIFRVMHEIVERHISGERLSAEEIAARTQGAGKTSQDYRVVGETAVVPVYGIIAKRASMVNDISQPEGTSIEQIRKDFDAAMADPKVSRVLMDIDSPGGSVDGVAEMANYIFRARGKKEIVAYANGLMASAAYWLGAAADKVISAPSAEVGSIGVYTVVNDYSVWNHNKGIKTEVIRAGKHKAAGHPGQPLSEDDRAVIKEQINDYYDMFTGAVSQFRAMSMEKTLKAATGRTFLGKRLVELGLVDGLDELDNLLGSSGASGKKAAAGSGDVGINENNKTIEEGKDMKLTAEQIKSEHPESAAALIKEGRDAGLAEGRAENAQAVEEAKKSALAEGKAAGVAEERARVSEVIKNSKAIPNAHEILGDVVAAGDAPAAALERFKSHQLGRIATSAPVSPGPGPEAASGEKDHITRAKEYQQANKCTLIKALSATADPRKK